MSKEHYKLPELITLDEYNGDFNSYLNAVYKLFSKDFLENRPMYRGVRLGLKKYPMKEGKEATFWHMITEGKDEANREFDLRRMERIRWPAKFINDSTHPCLKVWENTRKGKTNILIFHEEEGYLVVLRKAKDYLLPWTAYCINYPNRKRRLLEEYDAYIKSKELT